MGEFVASLASSPSHQPFCTALFAAAEEQERAEELARPALDHVLRVRTTHNSNIPRFCVRATRT